MLSKGIRGAITVDENTVESIHSATIELITELVRQNKIKPEMISHVIFTLTPDLNAEFPAKLEERLRIQNNVLRYLIVRDGE